VSKVLHWHPVCLYARRAGFSLVELLLVVVIIGIMLATGLPAYKNSVIKANRLVGRGILVEVLSRQEQYFVNRKTYARHLTQLGYSSDPFYIDARAQVYSSAHSAIYRLELQLATQRYTLTATPINQQAADHLCGYLAVNSLGVKSAGGSGGVSQCW